MVKAVVFDAYGTLFDVNSVRQRCEAEYPGRGAQINTLWRQKQLEYTWLRTLMGRYEGFGQLTQDALVYTLQALHQPATTQKVRSIMDAYLQLTPYPEVPEALKAFAPRTLAMLSNGELLMLERVLQNAGLNRFIHRIYSASEAGCYKPAPAVYQLGVDGLGLPKEDILFISSNAWDVAGAKSFGFTVGWVNRQAKPAERLGFLPDYCAATLLELARQACFEVARAPA